MMQTNARRRQSEQAFTLVECLIAIGILMVLAALLFAGYGRAMRAAEGTANLSSHRSIASGLLAYAGDHNYRLPWANDIAASVTYPKALCAGGYISDGMVFFNRKFWRRYGAGDNEGAYLVIQNPAKYASAIRPWAYTTYGVNRYGAMPISTDGRKPASLMRVGGDGNLSKLMLTRDVYQALNDTPANRLGGGAFWFANEGNLPNEDDTYAGMVHASFADGHAEGFRRDTIIEMMKSRSTAPLFAETYTRD